MGRWLICSISLIVVPFGSAETRWVRAESPHFEMISSASERDSLETLRQFEKVRDFFVQAMGVNSSNPGKTRLVVFGSGKAYEPYKLKGFASAWYMQRGDRDTIVMGNHSTTVFSVAIHEYVHLVTSHADSAFPRG